MLYAIPQGAPVLLVHAHSNGCDIGDMRQTLQSISDQLRVHVMSFEFPGYGLHIGSACKGSIDEAANLVLQYVLEELRINPAQVVWYGRSIGSGPAVSMAHRITKEMSQRPGGLILQCGYANFREVVKHLFGRVAQQLVSPLWQNEVMIRDLKCPILLIHGRADTMIPIEHSERNFAAASMKELSRFHACDCGHNDFNFQRCTLRPIYDFLLGVISAANFPTTNFTIEIPTNHRAFVHHIGPLRPKIPVYSFRRPELEEWIHRLQTRKQQKQAEGEAIEDGPREAGTGSQNKLEVDSREVRTSTVSATTSGTVTSSTSGTEKVGQSEPPPGRPNPETEKKKKRKKKGKADPNDDLPPIPNFCELPPIEDIEEALLDPEGMIRTCTHRVDAFLQRLQRQLDSIDGLESKPLEEVIDFVEAEFWASDPLLCLWEEVRLPQGQLVRTRLGPFFIESSGVCGYDADIGVGRPSSTDLLRVPIWVFCPSSAHFRCLAEWTLLQSERLEKSLPSPPASKSSCCCSPCCFKKKKKKSRNKRGIPDPTTHPTRGVLATSLAAHFVNWVDKTDEVRAIFARFVDVHRNPEQVMGRSAAAALVAAIQPKEEIAGETSRDTLDVNSPEFPGAEASPSSSSQQQANSTAKPNEESPWWYADLGKMAGSVAALDGSVSDQCKPPWQPSMFSASTRMLLRDRTGAAGYNLSEFYARLWNPHLSSGAELSPLGDLQACGNMLASSSAPNILPERNADWLAANLLYHYERLPRPPLEEPNTASSSSTTATDFLRADMRQASLMLNKAMKVFAHSEHKRSQRQRFRPTPKVPLPPDLPPGGDMMESKPAPTSPPMVSDQDGPAVDDLVDIDDDRPGSTDQTLSAL